MLPEPANSSYYSHSKKRSRCMSTSMQYKFLRRILKYRHMDFEFALWQMLYLCVSPRKVYRNFHYHKQTKDQWARDDPAFLVLLSIWLCASSIGFAVMLKLPFLGFLKFLLWVVFVDCIAVGLIIASLLWFFCNRYLRISTAQDPGQRVEWAYAFDVHLNAFFPLLLILHVIQLFCMKIIIDNPWFISRFIGNSLWLIALVYYIYISFLGYSVMDDLKQVKPQYISNVAVDYWRKKPILKEPSYAIMALSPSENERIDHQPGEPGVEDKLCPKYVNQTDAMVTSAAVMALSPEQEEPFRDLQMLLGFTLQKGIRSNPKESFGCGGNRDEIASKILSVLIQSIAALPIILIAAIWHSPWEMKKAEFAAIVLLVAYYLIFFGIAILLTGGQTLSFLDSFARWCHVHLYHVRMLREFFQVDHVGPSPPALLSLSDGGRLEKFGLLPLLKKRLKRILIVDGSFIVNDEDYAKQILRSMNQARKDLNCEFVGSGGRDVQEEMRKTYIDVPRGRQPRYYRFKVQYYDKKPDESYEKVKEGDIMIIAPRYPGFGESATNPNLENNWKQYHQDTGEELDEEQWGKGPVLRADEVDRLTFCCCECCHSSSKVLQ